MIVYGQAIYAKSLEILWKNQDEFKRVVLRMGAFHVSCCFLAVIGKRFDGAGLIDLFIEAEILGAESVSGVLEGRHYNRAVRVHKLFMEAFMHIQWEEFENWLNTENKQIENQEPITVDIHNLQQDISQDNYRKLLEND